VGNVTNANDSVEGNQTFTYDSVNRLVTAGSGSQGYSLTYAYNNDGSNGAYGNVTCVQGAGAGTCAQVVYQQPSNNSALSVTNNRVYSIGNTTVNYDPAGDMLNDVNCSYTYDGEQRMGSATCGGVATLYVYDGEGQRVAKLNASGAVSEQDVYNTAGQVLMRYNGSGWTEGEVWAGGNHLAIYANGQTYFPLTDQVGTERARFTSTGGIVETCMSQPFGDNLQCTGTDSSPYKFGKLERDLESGDDHAQQRDYNSNPYRWLTPDPLGGHLEDPQTLNKYAYVRNNPTSLTDPTGLDFYQQCQQTKDNTQTCNTVNGYGSLTFYGTTDQNGKFNATVTTSASLQDPNSGNTAVVNASGVQLTTANGTSEGVFINGTPSATIQGDPNAAGWSNFTFNVFGSDVQHGNLDYGTATYKWSSNQSDVISALNKMGPFSYPFENSVGNPKHPGDINFRFSTGEYPTLFNYGPSPHLLVPGDPGRTVPVGPGYVMGFHIDAQTGTVSHGACAWLDVGCQ
jgi:RHS repeat-associated protein